MLARYQIDANWRLRLLNHFVILDRDDTVLDAGCGDGFISTEVAGRVRRVVGADADRKIIEYNKKEAMVANLEFECADITDARGAERLAGKGPFTKIICLDALEHMDEPAKAIGNMALLLKLGGEVFITVPVEGEHGHRVEPGAVEGALRKNSMRVTLIKRIGYPPITAFIKRVLMGLQTLAGYAPKETDRFSETASFALEKRNPPLLRLYKLLFVLVIRPLTMFEPRPFRESGGHLVVMARKE